MAYYALVDFWFTLAGLVHFWYGERRNRKSQNRRRATPVALRRNRYVSQSIQR